MSRQITIHHSPDSDDAFMFYGLASGRVAVPGFEFRHELSDIESLNHRAIKGELEVTAVSLHAYAYLNNKYKILRSGGSFGGADYGPRLISRTKFELADGEFRTIAIPGKYTSAALALRLYLAEKGLEAELVNESFDQIPDAVLKGEVDAGVVIHEAQITHQRDGFVTLLDLGAWWWQETKLPLPLGVNIVRCDLGDDTIRTVARAVKSSVEYGLSNRREALEHAGKYGRGLSAGDTDKFVAMYVNERTVELGEEGLKSIRLFLEKGQKYGLIPAGTQVRFAG